MTAPKGPNGSHASQRHLPSAGSPPWDDLGQKLMMFGCLGSNWELFIIA